MPMNLKLKRVSENAFKDSANHMKMVPTLHRMRVQRRNKKNGVNLECCLCSDFLNLPFRHI